MLDVFSKLHKQTMPKMSLHFNITAFKAEKLKTPKRRLFSKTPSELLNRLLYPPESLILSSWIAYYILLNFLWAPRHTVHLDFNPGLSTLVFIIMSQSEVIVTACTWRKNAVGPFIVIFVKLTKSSSSSWAGLIPTFSTNPHDWPIGLTGLRVLSRN